MKNQWLSPNGPLRHSWHGADLKPNYKLAGASLGLLMNFEDRTHGGEDVAGTGIFFSLRGAGLGTVVGGTLELAADGVELQQPIS